MNNESIKVKTFIILIMIAFNKKLLTNVASGTAVTRKTFANFRSNALSVKTLIHANG
jgi:hypothetical protein